MAKLRWSLPFVFALMFWASYHPLNLGFLGFVSLVPLLLYAQTTSGRKSFFVAWAGGYVGEWLAKELSDYLNRTGSVIVIVTLIFLAIIMATHFSFGRLLDGAGIDDRLRYAT